MGVATLCIVAASHHRRSARAVGKVIRPAVVAVGVVCDGGWPPWLANEGDCAGMGQDVDRTTFSRHDRQRYRANVRRCLDALAVMLREHPFDTDEPMTGIEVELNLVGDSLEPALLGAAVLDSIGAPEFQTELGRWNLELNLPPRPLHGDQWGHFEQQLLDELGMARAKAQDHKTQ